MEVFMWGQDKIGFKNNSVKSSLLLAVQVAKMFPNMTMQLLIWVSSPPHLTVSPSGLALTPALEAQALAVLPNSSVAPLFLLGLVSCSRLWADGELWTGP